MTSGVTAILCALKKELQPFLGGFTQAAVTRRAMLDFLEGEIGGMPVVLVCCGVCKVNAAIAAQALIDRFAPSRVIMCGTAGGMDGRLKAGDTVVATETAYHDLISDTLTDMHPFFPDMFIKCDAGLVGACRKAAGHMPPGQRVFFGRMVTGEAFIELDGREEINGRFSPLCVDQETAAAAHVCYVNGTPFIAVRAVSDTEDDSGLDAFIRNAEMAAGRSAALVMAMLKELQ